jgi:hypothetical protein
MSSVVSSISMEATSVETESKLEHQEVPKEDAAVNIVRALKKWYRDWHLAVGHRSQLKKWTQGIGGSRKKLAAACRGMTRRATPAPRKGHSHQGPGKDNVVQETRKGRPFGKRRWAQPEAHLVKPGDSDQRWYIGYTLWC